MTGDAAFRPVHCNSVVMTFSADAPRSAVIIQLLISAVLLLLCLFPAAPVLAQNSAPRLSSDSDVATAGFFRLSWETEAGRVELQEATAPGFRSPVISYSGPDRATVISGKPNGEWYYRVRAVEEDRPESWSETVKVTVAHHNPSRALLFLSVGIVVFVAIVMMIVRGPGKTR